MIETKKNECANALKEVKRLCKEFGFYCLDARKGRQLKDGENSEILRN